MRCKTPGAPHGHSMQATGNAPQRARQCSQNVRVIRGDEPMALIKERGEPEIPWLSFLTCHALEMSHSERVLLVVGVFSERGTDRLIRVWQSASTVLPEKDEQLRNTYQRWVDLYRHVVDFHQRSRIKPDQRTDYLRQIPRYCPCKQDPFSLDHCNRANIPPHGANSMVFPENIAPPTP